MLAHSRCIGIQALSFSKRPVSWCACFYFLKSRCAGKEGHAIHPPEINTGGILLPERNELSA